MWREFNTKIWARFLIPVHLLCFYCCQGELYIIPATGWAEYCQPESHQWALAKKLRYRPQWQGLCPTPKWPLFRGLHREENGWPKNIFCSLVASSWQNSNAAVLDSWKVPMMHRAFVSPSIWVSHYSGWTAPETETVVLGSCTMFLE